MKSAFSLALVGSAAAFGASAKCGACIGNDFDALTQANIAIVEEYQNTVWAEKDVAKASNKFLTDATNQRSEGGDGIQGNIEGMSGYLNFFPDLYVVPKRTIGMGEYVLTHSEVHHEIGDNGWTTVDIFRVEDGKITDHWDFQQEMMGPDYAFGNANGYFGDGPMRTEAPCTFTPKAVEVANAFMKGFYVTPLQTSANYARLATENYNTDMIEHNPDGATGLSGYLEFVDYLVDLFPRWSWQQVKVIAQGDLVALIQYVVKDPSLTGTYSTEPQMHIGSEFGRPEVAVDIFRIDQQTEKIAEHWDVFASFEYYQGRTQSHADDMLVFP
jgi:predicted SnoaL-like aldol condensation-catalyzing enzyme